MDTSSWDHFHDSYDYVKEFYLVKVGGEILGRAWPNAGVMNLMDGTGRAVDPGEDVFVQLQHECSHLAARAVLRFACALFSRKKRGLLLDYDFTASESRVAAQIGMDVARHPDSSAYVVVLGAGLSPVIRDHAYLAASRAGSSHPWLVVDEPAAVARVQVESAPHLKQVPQVAAVPRRNGRIPSLAVLAAAVVGGWSTGVPSFGARAAPEDCTHGFGIKGGFSECSACGISSRRAK